MQLCLGWPDIRVRYNAAVCRIAWYKGRVWSVIQLYTLWPDIKWLSCWCPFYYWYRFVASAEADASQADIKQQWDMALISIFTCQALLAIYILHNTFQCVVRQELRSYKWYTHPKKVPPLKITLKDIQSPHKTCLFFIWMWASATRGLRKITMACYLGLIVQSGKYY